MPKTQIQSISEAAKSAIPGYTEAKIAVDTLARWRAERPAFATISDPLEDMRAAARAGVETAPEEIGARLIAAEQAIINYNRTSTAILNEHSAARSELNAIVTQGADHALEHLHAEILKRQDTIRDAHANLPGVTTAAQAMLNPDHREAWAKLADATRDVNEIRTTQWSLYRELIQDWPNNQRKLASVAFLTNALDYDHSLVTYRMSQWRLVRPDRFPVLTEYAAWLEAAPANPWPEPERGQPWWPGDDHAAYLVWATDVTGLWVPTVDQLQDAYDAATGAAVDVGNGGDRFLDGTPYKSDENEHTTFVRKTVIGRGLAQAEKSRARYYEITGGTPTTEGPAIVEPMWQ